ncbi:MAG: S-adenosyl-L-methionine-dependent methyltransferase [Linnemannia elongata]|nr:MAG: S-adenosyl-L-methionine-dependent methyltransferase [Linnemannia elongata]
MPRDCLACEKRWIQEEAKRNRLFKAGPKLCAMDIFAGCGGMSLGMKQSGMVETKYSIEFDQDAVATFIYNFPSVAVHNRDAGLLLKEAIFQTQVGGEQTTRRGKNKMAPLNPIMPAPGEVDFIYCGPPCQGFTSATGRSNRDDPKNSLVATAMAYVDFYRPRYLLLENVKGFTEIGDKVAEHKKAFVKFVMRCLTELGYQCRIAMLQAGHFGVPQSRYRFFVWAAKLGYTLPTFPLPTTTFITGISAFFDAPRNLHYNAHESFHYYGRRRYQAPDPMVTVRDAISDLPGFEYIHPDDVDKETGSVKMNRTGSFVRVNSLEKGSNRIGKITKYRTEPQCEYQRKMRCRVSGNDRIRNHITEFIQSTTVESIYKFDMAPKARLGSKGSRLDFDGFFNTVTSSADPMGTPGIVHPNQHRVTTIRERARAQGFPDTFVFPADQSPLKWRKQIGNAVPPPLAAALGGMLVEAMIQDKEHENGDRQRP